MAASIFTGAMRAASGILRPLNVLASSAYRNYAKNVYLNSALCTMHLRSIQTPVVSSTPRLVTSVRNLTHGHTATVLNRWNMSGKAKINVWLGCVVVSQSADTQLSTHRDPALFLEKVHRDKQADVFKFILRVAELVPSVLKPPLRTLTYCSIRKGKRKTVKSVVHRFLRLHCGLWLRRRAGYKKKLWKKSTARKKRLREFVFCNKTQSKLLDKMTTSFWKRRNWYAGDPYQMYHDRTNLRV